MIKIKSIYKGVYFVFSLFILVSTIIPFYNGSLFDYTFLLFTFIYWLFSFYKRKFISKLQIFIIIYFLISSIQLFSLLFVDLNLLNLSLPVSLRINALLIFIDLTNNNNILDKDFKKYLLIYPFIIFSTIIPLWSICNSIFGLSWRMGFQFYSKGFDPHFWPAMACSFITLTFLFSNINNYNFSKSKNF